MSLHHMVLSSALALALVACQTKSKSNHTEATGDGAAAAVRFENAEIYPRLFKDKITEVTIEGGPATRVVLRPVAGTWSIAEPLSEPADPRAIQYALQELEHLEWEARPVAETSAAWPQYKVGKNDVVTLRVVHDGVALPPLLVGKKHFARVGTSDKVYRMMHLSHFTFARELRFWRDRTVVRFDAGAVTALEVVDASGRRAVAARQAGTGPAPNDKSLPTDTWTLIEGKKIVAKFDPDIPAAMFRALQDLEAADIATVSQKEASLDTPRLSITIRAGADNPTVLIGGDADGTTYVGRKGVDRVWIMKKSQLASVDRAPLSWGRK